MTGDPRFGGRREGDPVVEGRGDLVADAGDCGRAGDDGEVADDAVDGANVADDDRAKPPSPTPRVGAGYDRIRRRLGRATGLFLCLDFDGTLAPIAEEPDAPAMTPANREALERLAGNPAVSVAVVSGRELADVRRRVDVEGLDYAGNHGLELSIDGEESIHPVAARRLPTLRRIRDELEAQLSPIPGVELEDKRLSLTVHVRQADPPDADLALERTTRVVRSLGGDDFRLADGKSIAEILPAIPAGKDHAVRVLRTGGRRDALPMFVGDDTSDEAAFKEVTTDGIAVHVGDDETAADYRVDDPAAVAEFLRWLDEVVARDAGRDERTGRGR